MKKAISLILALVMAFALTVPALAAGTAAGMVATPPPNMTTAEGTQVTEDGDKITFYNPDCGYSLTLSGVLSYEDVEMPVETVRIYHLTDDGSAKATVRNVDYAYNQFGYDFTYCGFDVSVKKYEPNLGGGAIHQVQQCGPGSEVSWNLGSTKSFYDDYGFLGEWLAQFTSYSFMSVERYDEENINDFVYTHFYEVLIATDGGRVSYTKHTIDGIPFADYLAREKAAAAPHVERSAQNLTVNGVKKDVDKYNIDGSNYFKLRDLALLLNGTSARFSVGWDGATGTVTITTGQPYTPNGGEMVIGADLSDTARPSAQTIIINGARRSDLSVYNLGGGNFFKLRDLGAALGFDVDFDAATNTAVVKTQ